MFNEIRKTIREVKRRAHLWPPGLRGNSSCCVNRLMNQPWRVSSRLFNQRFDGVGYRIQGRANARAISGMPR